MTSHLPQPSDEAVFAAQHAIRRVVDQAPWYARLVLRERSPLRTALALETARRVEYRVTGRLREETTAAINQTWIDAIEGAKADPPPQHSGVIVTCAKCGRTAVTRDRYRQPKSPADPVMPFLDRACGHCGFEWRERCADAKPQNGAQDAAEPDLAVGDREASEGAVSGSPLTAAAHSGGSLPAAVDLGAADRG